MAAAGTTRCKQCGAFVKNMGQHRRWHHSNDKLQKTRELNQTLMDSVQLETKRGDLESTLAFLQERRDYYYTSAESISRVIDSLTQAESK